MKTRKPIGGKIADRLKAFESTPGYEEAATDAPPPPPPPPAATIKKKSRKGKEVEEVEARSLYSKRGHKSSDVPGAFPDDDYQNEDDIVEVIDMSEKPKKSKKSKSASTAAPPPPPPAVPDAPLTPPSEPKPRKERAKISRGDGASWGMWSASTPQKDSKKSSSKSKSERVKTAHEKEEKSSSKGSTSDKAERDTKTPSKPRTSGVISTPVSRTMSTRDKRHSVAGKTSRRHSYDVNHGLVSPPPEPEITGKAAKILGVEKTSSRRMSKARGKFGKSCIQRADLTVFQLSRRTMISLLSAPPSRARKKQTAVDPR